MVQSAECACFRKTDKQTTLIIPFGGSAKEIGIAAVKNLISVLVEQLH